MTALRPKPGPLRLTAPPPPSAAARLTTGLASNARRLALPWMPAPATATLETPEGDDIAFGKETLETIFEMLEVEANVEIRPPEAPGRGGGPVPVGRE